MVTRLKGHERQLLGELTPALKRYFTEYERDFQRFHAITHQEELFWAVQKSHITLCGDYHTLRQAQRTVIQLLDQSLPFWTRRKRDVALALEMLRPKDEKAVSQFFRGEISEIQFLKKIEFQRRWGFRWENYRPLMMWAKEHSVKVIGLNLETKSGLESLEKRDQAASQVMLKYLRLHPRTNLFAVMGDLHLAESHLPRCLKEGLESMGMIRRVLTIHQNHEKLYWVLVQRGIEKSANVIRLKKNVYCLVNTPPWVKLNSQVQWVEGIIDEDAPKIYQMGQKIPWVCSGEEILELLRVMTRFLGVSERIEDDFDLGDPEDLDFLKRIPEYPCVDFKTHEYCVKHFGSHFIPKLNLIYLKKTSMNHMATQAAHFLHHQLSGATINFINLKNDFFPWVFFEALGYLGSKIINPSRQCYTLEDLRNEITSKNSDDILAIQLAIEILTEVRLTAQAKLIGAGNPLVYLKAAKIIGKALGEAMFHSAMNGITTRQQIHSLFRNSFSSPEGTANLFALWSRRLLS